MSDPKANEMTATMVGLRQAERRRRKIAYVADKLFELHAEASHENMAAVAIQAADEWEAINTMPQDRHE